MCAIPIVLTPKNDGGWRTCIHSRAVNKIISRYRFPLAGIDDIIDCLSGVAYFSK